MSDEYEEDLPLSLSHVLIVTVLGFIVLAYLGVAALVVWLW